LQSQFIQKVFQAWDTYYSNIKSISFFKTTDWPQSIVDTVAVQLGMPNDSVFKAILLSLGSALTPATEQTNPLTILYFANWKKGAFVSPDAPLQA